MLEHNRAMGYSARQPEATQIQHMPSQISLIEAANAAFAVPFQLHETFRAWISRNRMARFDCFQEPSWGCPCYTCETCCVKKEVDVLMREGIMKEQRTQAIHGIMKEQLNTGPPS